MIAPLCLGIITIEPLFVTTFGGDDSSSYFHFGTLNCCLSARVLYTGDVGEKTIRSQKKEEKRGYKNNQKRDEKIDKKNKQPNNHNI